MHGKNLGNSTQVILWKFSIGCESWEGMWRSNCLMVTWDWGVLWRKRQQSCQSWGWVTMTCLSNYKKFNVGVFVPLDIDSMWFSCGNSFWGRPVFFRVFSHIPHLCSLEASIISSPYSWQSKVFLQIVKCHWEQPLIEQRTTNLECRLWGKASWKMRLKWGPGHGNSLLPY